MNIPPSGGDRPTLPGIPATPPAPVNPSAPMTPAAPIGNGPSGPSGPPTSRDRTTLLIVTGAAVVAVVAAVAVIALVFVGKGSDSDAASSTSTTPPSQVLAATTKRSSTTGGSAVPTIEPTIAPTSTGSTTVATPSTLGTVKPPRGTVVDSASALDQLRETAAADEATADATIADHWVAQLSSKWIAMSAGGKTWTAADILAEHNALRNAYGALLLDSTGWGFKRTGNWVTVTSVGFATAELANSWCDRHGMPAGDCFAKFIHRGPWFDGDVVKR